MTSEEVIVTLGDEYNPDILAAADEAVSAQELSDRLGVPLATCYRRIDDLTEAGLLELSDRVLSDRGGRTNVYRRCTDEVRIEFEGREFTVEVADRDSVKSKLDDVWRSSTRT